MRDTEKREKARELCEAAAEKESERILRRLDEAARQDADTVQLYVPMSLEEDSIPIEVSLSRDEIGDYLFTDFCETWETAGADESPGAERRLREAAAEAGVTVGEDRELSLPSSKETLIADCLRFAFFLDEVLGS